MYIVRYKLYRKKETLFFNPLLTPRDKRKKSRNLTAHIQDTPNDIIE